MTWLDWLTPDVLLAVVLFGLFIASVVTVVWPRRSKL